MTTRDNGFTIVELLVVIVVIGVLASISIVSYVGINQRAIAASLQSDLAVAANQLKMFSVDNGQYPATISTNCNTNPDTTTNKCLSPSSGNSISNSNYSSGSSGQSFYLMESNNGTCYDVSSSSAPSVNPLCIPFIVIGSQMWMSQNLNVGTYITSGTAQTNNGVIEKYCMFDSGSAACNSPNGGLYTWSEAMNYSTTEGAQGICPTGSHIPSDNDINTLVTYLGGWSVAGGAMKATSGWSAPNTGATNSSGFNLAAPGLWNGSSYVRNSQGGYFWSSTNNGSLGNMDYGDYASNQLFHSTNAASNLALPVRCIRN